MTKMILSDVHTTFYKILDANEELADKRFLDLEKAKEIAEKNSVEVFKVTKRITETMEMEKV